MGWSPRYFRWEEGDWTRLRIGWMQGFLDGRERVEDGLPLLTATVYVQFENRVPVALLKPRFDQWPLLPDGTLARGQLQQTAAATVGSRLEQVWSWSGRRSLLHTRPGRPPGSTAFTWAFS